MAEPVLQACDVWFDRIADVHRSLATTAATGPSSRGVLNCITIIAAHDGRFVTLDEGSVASDEAKTTPGDYIFGVSHTYLAVCDARRQHDTDQRGHVVHRIYCGQHWPDHLPLVHMR